jgi:hypothetical protein
MSFFFVSLTLSAQILRGTAAHLPRTNHLVHVLSSLSVIALLDKQGFVCVFEKQPIKAKKKHSVPHVGRLVMAPSDSPKSVLFFGHGADHTTTATSSSQKQAARNALRRRQTTAYSGGGGASSTPNSLHHPLPPPGSADAPEHPAFSSQHSLDASVVSSSPLHVAHNRKARLKAAAAETLDLLPAPGTVNDVKFARSTWKQFMMTLKPIGLSVLLNGFCRSMRHDAHAINNHVAAATTVMKVGLVVRWCCTLFVSMLLR